MKKKKIPLRKCVGCGENKPKNNLIRIVKNKENGVKVDPTGKMNGRGAYVCADKNCIDNTRKNKKLEKTLRVGIPDEIYEELYDIIS